MYKHLPAELVWALSALRGQNIAYCIPHIYRIHTEKGRSYILELSQCLSSSSVYSLSYY